MKTPIIIETAADVPIGNITYINPIISDNIEEMYILV